MLGFYPSKYQFKINWLSVEFSTYFRYLYVLVHETCKGCYLETFIWWYFFTKGYMNVREHCDKETFSISQYNYSREPNTRQGLVQNVCGGGGVLKSHWRRSKRACSPVIFPVDFLELLMRLYKHNLGTFFPLIPLDEIYICWLLSYGKFKVAFVRYKQAPSFFLPFYSTSNILKSSKWI